MQRIIAQLFSRLNRSQEGATAVEYAVMVALIAAIVIAGATALGSASNQEMCGVAGDIASTADDC